MALTSESDLIQYVRRRLGEPVLSLNIDDDQISDRISDALQIYQDYHFDATQLYYWKHVITEQDVTQKYFNVHPDIIGITRIFPVSDSLTQSSMFDLRYQLRLHDLWDFTTTSYVNYVVTMTHLRDLELLFTGEIPIRFQRHTHRLYVDASSTVLHPGTMIVAEGYQVLDPDLFEDVWNDRFLKNYATALVKRQWGENMKKFGNVPLPGGIVLNGQQIYDEAVSEIQKLETELDQNYTIPPAFIMG